jgi:Na+:H+ antiporter, NhaA family
MTAGRPRYSARTALEAFLHTETAGGVVLFAATVLALVWENSPWYATYEHLWELRLGHVGWVVDIDVSLHFLVNEVLMTLFFFVVGLEIRREAHDGALASVKLAALPVAAAAGGVLAPALIYLGISGDTEHAGGWAVPTATDIAFAVGVLTLLGPRVPPALRALLLALAIADDVAAIVIIAIVFAGGVSLAGVAIAAAGIGVVIALRKLGVSAEIVYALPGTVLWVGLLDAGIHPVLAGVILGLLTPMTPRRTGETPPAVRVERLLHPWIAFVVMPLFALANAGIRIGGIDLGEPALRTLVVAVSAGLVVGKPLGIVTTAWLAVRLGWCALPRGVRFSGMLVIGCLGGIGFTMAIFIATLAFPSADALAAAKLAVLVGSAVAAVLGLALGSRLLRRPS